MILLTLINSTVLNSVYASVCVDLLVACIIIFLLYKENEMIIFSFYDLLLFNIVVLMLCVVLFRFEISVGTGIGLFAVLAMLRFRSEIIKVRDMLNLLLLIAIGVVHAAFPFVLSVFELVFVDMVILMMGVCIHFSNKNLSTIKMTLDNLNLIKHENKYELHLMLEKKLGCRVMKYSILDINFNRNKIEVLAVVDRNCIKNRNTNVQVNSHMNIIPNGKTTNSQVINREDIVNI